MPNDDRVQPVAYYGVMVSSTFKDLVQHRKALIDAINAHKMMAVAMEDDTAKPAGDVLDSSMQMVRDAAGYVCVIANKYGQIPEDDQRNPQGLSLTELEFNEARRLDRPVLLFIMGDTHPITRGDVEQVPEKAKKLAAFRENAMRLGPDSKVHRVYQEFNSLQQFELKAMQALAGLREHLERTRTPQGEPGPVEQETPSIVIPEPPLLYAEPPYIGSHEFVGRDAQLATLSEWAAAADPHPVLLFDAIGGTGKSMLTWEWTTKHATTARNEWAGRFWYSFYEKGAVMADFCRRALAYMTRRSLGDFKKMKTAELSELLLQQLRARPWLVVLDGLERVLVAYHRIDAAQLADEEAGGSDAIAKRDPSAAIRPEDDELLRALAAAAPSKLLVTSRLIPRILVNAAGQPISGVRHERLPGLRPADAEALLRSCGIDGTSETIQQYLQSQCDCHPLVTGVLAGLVNDYLPARGNFDTWVTARDGGAALNLAELNLVAKRNHILKAALEALPEKSRQLLSTLALLAESVDYAVLSALNPHLPPEPEEVEEPRELDHWYLDVLSEDEKRHAGQEYAATLERRQKYEQAIAEYRRSAAFLKAAQKLAPTVRDLERRGLLQYDAQVRRYDLHPVVRALAAGSLRTEERDSYGQRVVDYFSRQTHRPYREVESLEDIANDLHVVRTLLRMEQYSSASMTYRVSSGGSSGSLAEALLFNLEEHATALALLRPFFPDGWGSLPALDDESDAAYLANESGFALARMAQSAEALAAYIVGLQVNVRETAWGNVRSLLSNISWTLHDQNRIAAAERCQVSSLDLATVIEDKEAIFRACLDRFGLLSSIGREQEAEEMWKLLDPMGRNWNRRVYRSGNAELELARFRFLQGRLAEELLVDAEKLAGADRNRPAIRAIHGMRGAWQLKRREWALAAASLQEAVRMAREVGMRDPTAEAQLALAKFHLGRLSDPRHEATQLSAARDPSHGNLADLWLAIGDREQATKHALASYKWAWADGEPYVHRYALNNARTLLEQLGVEVPNLALYDPAKDEKFPWEDEVAAAIEKLRKEKKKEARKKRQAEKKSRKADPAQPA